MPGSAPRLRTVNHCATYAVGIKSAALHGNKVKVLGSKRNGPMPHGGYRPFDVSAIGKAFPDLKMTQLMEGIEAVHRELAG